MKQTVTVNNNVIFKWSAWHNVWKFPDQAAFDACDFSKATELASVNQNPFTYKAPSAGIVYFGCQVGGGVHCKLNQKLALTVTAETAPIKAPAKATTNQPNLRKSKKQLKAEKKQKQKAAAAAKKKAAAEKKRQQKAAIAAKKKAAAEAKKKKKQEAAAKKKAAAEAKKKKKQAAAAAKKLRKVNNINNKNKNSRKKKKKKKGEK